MKKLSILILSLHSRKEYLDRLLEILRQQTTEDVEVLTEIDDGKLSIGDKRNRLLDKATGEYICYLDDDDLISSDYVQKILKAIESKPDCVGIHLLHFHDGSLVGFTYHSLRYSSWFEVKDTVVGFMRYYRNPNHLNPVKREIAIKCSFPNTSWGEDRDYSKNILQYLKTEEYICEPIYYYLFRSKK